MMKHNDFRRRGIVSVWIGNFATDGELDDYLNLSRTFEHDFGFELNNRDMPEAVVEASPTSIADLVAGFSGSKSYAAAVVNLASAQGISQATTMVVFFNLEYQPERARPKENAALRFLGTVQFS